MKNFIDALHTTEITYLPAGRYWVGDPCYVIPGNNWHDFIDFTEENGLNTYKGHDFFLVNTGGDGCWDHNGETYGVDAGMIAVLPAALVDESDNAHAGVFVELTDYTDVGYITNNYGGLLEVFAGEVVITWMEVENEEIAEYAYENDDYSVITTDELFAELMTYLNDCADEDEIEEARKALPQFA